VESIGALADRTVAFCRTTFDQRIAFETRYDHAARARVDPAQIEQAILNALINARDALAEADVDGPRVTIDVAIVPGGSPELEGRSGDYVRIRIGDNGAGMDADVAGRIFEPFFTTKPVGKGTGLGLAITRATIVEHGGFVTCDSAPRRGTTFSLYIERESGPSEAPRAAVEERTIRGTETVLVVDDEAPIRNLVALMLSSAGFVAKLAASGDEAVSLLSDPRVAGEVALVLLDVSMPGMSGRELRRRLGELVPRARVVYFTGYAFEAADASDAVIEKPVTERQLLGTIRDVLDRGRPIASAASAR
jgi:CheY-like chemotaxis protein